MVSRSRWSLALQKRRTRIALAVAIGALLVEVIGLPMLAAFAPLRLRLKLPGPLYVLSQTSKATLLPHDWTLVLGDSYAHGYGDWLNTVQHDPGNPGFHSTHVLHELTGTDVMSFGQGGAGSVKSIVYLPEKRLTALKRTGLGDPSRIVVLVYEGNDFVNNITETERYGELCAGDDEAALAAHCIARGRSGQRAGWIGTLFFPGLILNAVKGRQGVRPDAAGTNLLPVGAESAGPLETEATNVVRVDGELLRFVGPAQGPPLGMDEARLDWSLMTLKASLSWLSNRFDDTPIQLVLVPSPLSCYDLVSSHVELDSSGSAEVTFEAECVEATHRDVVGRVRAVAKELGLDFLDATPALRAATETQFVHGPLDGSHFNRAGYEALGRALAP